MKIKIDNLLCHTVMQGGFHQFVLQILFDSVKSLTVGGHNALFLLETFKCDLSKKRKRLMTGAVLVNNSLFIVTLPVSNFLLTGTVQ